MCILFHLNSQIKGPGSKGPSVDYIRNYTYNVYPFPLFLLVISNKLAAYVINGRLLKACKQYEGF